MFRNRPTNHAFTLLRPQVRSRWTRVVVPTNHCAIEDVDGVRTRVLDAGPHRKVRRAAYTLVDLRGRLTVTAPQEVLTADRLTLRVTVATAWRVVDALAFTERVDDAAARVYLAVQVALRELAAATTAEEIAQRTATLDTAVLLAAAREAGEAVGIEVQEVVLKDVILPVELRSAATELATARQRGAAQLEAARAETAATRALANAGRVLDAHPALAQLRIVQSAPPGARVVLAVGEGWRDAATVVTD